jgi:hypothetical protein
MAAIRFRAVVGEEQVIRPPVGVRLPQGEIEVTVQPRQEVSSGQADALAPTRDWLLAAEAEKAAPALPADLAVHHDHYAHGKPLP